MSWQKVASWRAIPDGDVLDTDVSGTLVALYKINGEIFATHGICTHAMAILAEGFVQGAIGAGFAVGLVYFLKWIITKLLKNQHNLLQPFYASSHDVFVIGALVLAIGAVIGVMGSMIGLRRFLEA